MKKLMSILILITVLSTGSHVFGQLSGGSTSVGPQPVPPHAGPAFYASYNAYLRATNEANDWRSQPYYPNASVAAAYWQISANYQYQALVRIYSVWSGLEDRGYIMPIDRQLAMEAETYSLYAWWYAAAGRSVVGPSCEPALQAQQNAHDELQLLIDDFVTWGWFW